MHLGQVELPLDGMTGSSTPAMTAPETFMKVLRLKMIPISYDVASSCIKPDLPEKRIS
ncbi:hypothetical protein DAMNIGENAA_14420 [Desulforhabdus amnigena]|uniref:Uncharacterized protein n=1 Tax=Desulforhabdus amnigena TaxID=40218 RepID=A0A9W6FSG4_9BACT|nr:hypothetical protein DAMNIGENAA_14420 [Desulforhabdus amnigena]